MRIFSLVLLATAPLACCLAQDPPLLRLPRLAGENRATERNLPPVQNDPVLLYQSRREAALAAFQAGYTAGTTERNRNRAMSLLLVALKRDPGLGKGLFNLGVLCTQEERWQDAISFYLAAQRADLDPQMAKLAGDEADRLKVVAQLQGTPDGKRRREFDLQLVALIRKAKDTKDPIPVIEDAKQLARKDSTRWEPLGLTGILQATLGAFPQSLEALEAAARLAPTALRAKVQSAADVARRETKFLELSKQGDELIDKLQYEAAAKSYAEAWESSPARLDIGLQAATDFLMADQIPLAIQVLSRLHDTGTPEMSAKAVAMLVELGAVSDEAKREASHGSATETEPVPTNATDQIRTLFASLTTPQMELSTKPIPPLIQDQTHVTPIPDTELTAGRSDLLLLSTQSVFAQYEQSANLSKPQPPLGDSQPPAAPPLGPPPDTRPTTPPAPDRPTLPALSRPNAPPESGPPQPASQPTVPLEPPRGPATPSQPPAAFKPIGDGPTQDVAIESTPPGAVIVFDSSPDSSCKTPCRVPLTSGRHTLKANLLGYREVLKIFNVDKKNASLDLKFEAKRGALLVETASAGVQIFMNGQKTGRVTPANFDLAEGEYDIAVEVEGQLQSRKVIVKDGSLLKVTF